MTVVTPAMRKIHPKATFAAIVDKKGNAIAATPPSNSTMPRIRYQTQCSAICAWALARASLTSCPVSVTPASIAAWDIRSTICRLPYARLPFGVCSHPVRFSVGQRAVVGDRQEQSYSRGALEERHSATALRGDVYL